MKSQSVNVNIAISDDNRTLCEGNIQVVDDICKFSSLCHNFKNDIMTKSMRKQKNHKNSYKPVHFMVLNFGVNSALLFHTESDFSSGKTYRQKKNGQVLSVT